MSLSFTSSEYFGGVNALVLVYGIDFTFYDYPTFCWTSRCFFSRNSQKAKALMKNDVVRVSWRQCNTSDTVPMDVSKPSGPRTGFKNKNNLECHRSDVSEIKLKRTDTTLDLSHRALKMMVSMFHVVIGMAWRHLQES